MRIGRFPLLFSLLLSPQCLDLTGFEGAFCPYFFPYFSVIKQTEKVNLPCG